jgi:hypothetical protein
MDLIFSAAMVTLLVIAAAAAWPAMYAVYSRALASDTRELNFWQVVKHRGLTTKDLAASTPDAAQAMYRCIACPEAARCDERLAESRFDEIDGFCPNRPFLERLAATHRRA